MYTRQITREDLNKKAFYIGKIGFRPQSDTMPIEVTYGEFLREFGSDETTTPRGVASRLFVSEFSKTIKNEDEDGNELADTYENVWQLRAWGISGNGPSSLVDEFETEEEAHLAWYQAAIFQVEEECDVPRLFFSLKECAEEIADLENESAAETDSEDENEDEIVTAESVIARIEEFAVLCKREKEQEEKRQLNKEILKRQATNEANNIEIDSTFALNVVSAKQLSGQEKHKAMSTAMTNFLERIGKEKIESDFWLVFKILSGRVS